MQFLLWAAPRTVVYRDKISCPCVKGFPSYEGVIEGWIPPKKTLFAVIGSYSVKTVADRYRHVAYHNKVTGFLVLSTSMTLNSLKPPKLGVFVNFS